MRTIQKQAIWNLSISQPKDLRGWMLIFSNINKLVIRASGNPEDEMDNRYWLMDNFTYDEAVATPEPLTATLFGISLLGLAGLRRRLS